MKTNQGGATLNSHRQSSRGEKRTWLQKVKQEEDVFRHGLVAFADNLEQTKKSFVLNSEKKQQRKINGYGKSENKQRKMATVTFCYESQTETEHFSSGLSNLMS